MHTTNPNCPPKTPKFLKKMVNQQTVSGKAPLKILTISKVNGTHRKKNAYKKTIFSPYVKTVRNLFSWMCRKMNMNAGTRQINVIMEMHKMKCLMYGASNSSYQKSSAKNQQYSAVKHKYVSIKLTFRKLSYCDLLIECEAHVHLADLMVRSPLMFKYKIILVLGQVRKLKLSCKYKSYTRCIWS